MTTKETDILNYSNPSTVQKLARQYLGNDARVYLSTRAGKKYQIKDPNGNWVHFGAWGYEDFTKHKDETRRKQFQQRNAMWKAADKWSPAFLSYHLLW
jgi:hypothetical protein